jgi:hypothetical protein
MATLTIHRNTEYNNRWRDYQILCNGKKLGSIANAESKSFTLPAGTYTLEANIDWCGSQPLHIELQENESQEITVSGFRLGKWLMPATGIVVVLHFLINNLIGRFDYLIFLVFPGFLYLIYMLSFGRKKYLVLENGNTLETAGSWKDRLQ